MLDRWGGCNFEKPGNISLKEPWALRALSNFENFQNPGDICRKESPESRWRRRIKVSKCRDVYQQLFMLLRPCPRIAGNLHSLSNFYSLNTRHGQKLKQMFSSSFLRLSEIWVPNRKHNFSVFSLCASYLDYLLLHSQVARSLNAEEILSTNWMQTHLLQCSHTHEGFLKSFFFIVINHFWLTSNMHDASSLHWIV